MKMFSINGAAELLERDRRTLVKALRGVAPNSHERNQPRWRLPVIIQALESMTQPRRSSGVSSGNVFDDLDADLAHDRRALALFDGFNRAYAKMEAERSLAKRREMAISIIPKTLDEALGPYRTRCVVSREFIDAGSRVDLMHSHMLENFEKLCGWSRDEVWTHLIADVEED